MGSSYFYSFVYAAHLLHHIPFNNKRRNPTIFLCLFHASSNALPSLICFMQCNISFSICYPNMRHSTFSPSDITLCPKYLFIAVSFIQAKYNTNVHHPFVACTPCLHHTKNHDIPARKTKPTSFNL